MKEGLRHPLYREAMLRYFGFLAMWDVVLGVPKLQLFGLKNGKNKYINVIYYIYNKKYILYKKAVNDFQKPTNY
jgi:hypothetical protein